MLAAFQIRPVSTADDLRASLALFEAYAASLPVDLAQQGFDTELAAMPGQYAPPRGALLLARDSQSEPVGCVALRPLPDEGCCEMKRLYVSPAGRGLGLGRALAEAIIEQGRRIGYRELRLDTLPGMTAAIGLYRDLGFAAIAPYNDAPFAGTIFLALALGAG